MLYGGDHGRKALHLVLVKFDHAKAPVVILGNERLDAGGLAGARISVEKAVVCLKPHDKRLGIVLELSLCYLITDHVEKDNKTNDIM